MQDSLGGNAKTLMFVNFSPADYNADETSTSLMYASRVKKIVNNASKVILVLTVNCTIIILSHFLNSKRKVKKLRD